MNGVHDIGGMDGFGPIHREADEPVFHEPWESRVVGMLLTGAGPPPEPLDAFRHRLERLDPIKYLSSSYYVAADPDLPMPRREDPARAEHLANAFRAGRPESKRKIRQKPRFAVGDTIVTRNLNPPGHTRLPRYTRGKRGVIVAHHGAHVFPDTNAHGLGENPQHLYTVRIAARELWGGGAEPNESVLIDLWDSYLEKDKTAAKSAVQKPMPAVKKVVAKPPARATKMPARAAASKRSFAAPLPSLTAAAPVKSKRARTTVGAGRGSARSGRGSGKPMRKSR